MSIAPGNFDALALPAVPQAAPADHVGRDRIAAALFLLALFLPLIGAIANREVATTLFEKRRTAPWPSLSGAPASWNTWTAEFDAAFADRFGGRDALIAVHHRTKALGFGVSPINTVLLGRDGWLYFLGEEGEAVNRDYRGVTPYPASDMPRTAAELKRRHDFLAALGIPYVVMIVPDKATIHPEHLPQWMRRASGPTRLDALYAALAAYPEVSVLDLRPALTAGKARERNYFATDSHWNLLGATIGYEALAATLKAKVPRFPAVPPPRPIFVKGVDFWAGDLSTLTGLTRTHREDDIAPLGRLLADTSSRCAKLADASFSPGVAAPRAETFVYTCERPELPTALVYRDSMMIPVMPLLSENFRRVVYVSDRLMDRAFVERERPDVVIEEMVERSIHAPGLTPF